MPLLAGPEGSAPRVLQMLHGLQPMFAQHDRLVESLVLSGRGSWRARLESGAVIEMGQGEPADIQARMQRFVATVSQTSSKFGRDLESADLRYENGYALKLRGVTTVGDGKKDRK